MNAALLSLILLCPLPQGEAPDLSSPDKAAKAWADFWMDLQHKSNPFLELMGKSEEITLVAMTPAAQNKQKEKLEKQKEMFKGSETLSWETKVQAVEDAEGGGKEVTVEVTRTFNKKDWRTKAVTKETEVQPHKYVLAQSGGKWLVKTVWRPCYSCKAKGVCGSCKGTGKRAGGTGDCFRCSGKKGCELCKGKKFKEEKIAKVGMRFIKDSIKVEVTEDYSTPQKAAATWIALDRKKELAASRSLGAWVRKTLKTMRQYLVPEMVKEIDTNIAKGLEEGTKRFVEGKPKLKSVEEEQNGTAFAVISSPPGGGLMGGGAPPPEARKKSKGPTEVLKRLVLKKTGDKWLVDEVQRSCYSCAGNGKCKQCNGKPASGKCWSCKDTNTCRWCKGKGWRGDGL